VSQSPVRKLRVFQPDLYVSADLQEGRLRYVREAGGQIAESEERYEGGDALAVQAAAFVQALRGATRVAVSGEDGRQALEWALEIGRRVRERLTRYAGGA
jgi:predicted dehydrogenase